MSNHDTVPRRIVSIAQPCTGEEEWHAVREPLMSGWLTQGPKVAAFEQAFADRHGVGRAIATTSCTTALHLILAALGIGPGDEVIVPAFTWISTANAVLYCGATPVFADVDPVTFNLDAARVRERVTSRTAVVMPVHLFGLCADVAAIREAAPGVPIVEDAACAAGSEYRRAPAGGLGVAAAFSFHPRKSITTGEGGMITTNDDALADRLVQMRNHGASVSEEERHHGPRPHALPEFAVLGYNYRMTDIQAAIGLVQLGKLDAFISEREHWARYYADHLGAIPWLTPPTTPADLRHAWQAYVCWVDEEAAPLSRNALMAALHERGVATRPGTHAVHVQSLYRDRFGLAPEDFPVAYRAHQRAMALPLHNRMDEADFAYVVEAIRACA